MPLTRSKFNRDVDRIMDLDQWMRQSKLLTEQRDTAQEALEAERRTTAQLRQEVEQLSKEAGGGNQQLLSTIDQQKQENTRLTGLTEQLKQENARLSNLTERQRGSLDETLASLTLVSDELEKQRAVHADEMAKQREAFAAELTKQKEAFMANLAAQKKDAMQAEKDMDKLAEELMAERQRAKQAATEKNIVQNVHVVELISNNQQIDTVVLGGDKIEEAVTFINSMAYIAEQELHIRLDHESILQRAKYVMFNPVINEHNVIVHGGNWAIIHRLVEVQV